MRISDWSSDVCSSDLLAEHLASHKLVADLHANFGEMAEHADQPLAVVDENGLAVEEVVTGEYDLAGRRCLDRRAALGGEIQARVRVTLLAVEETAQAERRRQRAVHRAIEQQIAWLVGAELPVGAGLFVKRSE